MENNHVVHSVRVTLLCCAAPVTHVILVSVSVLQTDELWVSWEAATSWSSLKLCMDELMVLCHSLAQQGNGPPSSRLFATQDFKRQPCFDDMLSFKAQTLFLQSCPDGEVVQWRASGRTDIVRNRPVILQRQPQENLLWRSLSPVFAVVAYLNYWTKNESSCRNSIFF